MKVTEFDEVPSALLTTTLHVPAVPDGGMIWYEICEFDAMVNRLEVLGYVVPVGAVVVAALGGIGAVGLQPQLARPAVRIGDEDGVAESLGKQADEVVRSAGAGGRKQAGNQEEA